MSRNNGIWKFSLVAAITLITNSVVAQEVLPQESGIAANYPGDNEIENDAAVVFAENFDAASLDEVVGRWESIENKEALSLSSDAPLVKTGGKSLLITHVGGKSTGAHLYRRLAPGFEKLHYRFYVKFDPKCAPIHHFFHVGGYNPSTAWPQGGAGQRPRGDERFSTGIEPFGSEWRWDFYSYWMEMRGSPPRGQTWGNSFVHDERFKVARGKWICVETMLKMNDVGKANGEMALWIDGELARWIGQGFPKGKWVFDKFLTDEGGDGVRWSEEKKGAETLSFPEGGLPFDGFRWRSDEKLNLNFLWVLLYITKAPPGHESKVWFDNIVVATDYIGPIGKDE